MSRKQAWTRMVLVRHGESNSTVARRIGGPRTCTGLSELGVRQAERLHDRLAATREISADVVYASAYPRAIATAEVIAPALARDVVVDSELGETDPGPLCDGMSFDDYTAQYGMPDWESDPHAATFEGGESVADLHYRVGRAWSGLVRRHEGETVVAVCHGGVIDAVLRLALRAPATGSFDLHTANTSLTELVLARPGRWRLVRYNDAAHLAGLPNETPREGRS